MIDQALLFIKNRLNAHLGMRSDTMLDQASQDLVAFVNTDKLDSIDFKMNTVSVMLVNAEQERTLRPRTLSPGQEPTAPCSGSTPTSG